MDIDKSHRLSKYSSLIKDMVNYEEISGYLLQSRVISYTDHTNFMAVAGTKGNSSAMLELTCVLGLRRGGYDVFLGALRQNDYNWLADQMDPRPVEISTSPKGILPALTSGFKKRKSSCTTERLSADTIFTSYRQSIPMDLNGTTTLHSARSSKDMEGSSRGNSVEEFSSKFISASLDNLKLEKAGESSGPYQFTNSEDMECCGGGSSRDNAISRTSTFRCPAVPPLQQGKNAIIYNIPETEKSERDLELVSSIAQRLSIPVDSFPILKATRIGRVSKQNSYTRPLKVKFKSPEVRDKFIKLMRDQLNSMPNVGLPISNVDIEPYDKKVEKELSSSMKDLFKAGSTSSSDKNSSSNNSHWYLPSNFFNSLKRRHSHKPM